MRDDQRRWCLGASPRTVTLWFSTQSDYGLDGSHHVLIPKEKGRILEEMDVIFGVVQGDKRKVDIAQHDAVRSLCLY